ncbi:hypothetical protein Tco_1513584, partial [Tanacetum coccineum]
NKNGYVGKLPIYNKCKLHHTGPCTVKCNNCKRVGHMTRNYRTPVPATTQRPPVANYKPALTFFRYGAQGHFKSDSQGLRIRIVVIRKERKEKLARTLTSLQIMLMLKERSSRLA